MLSHLLVKLIRYNHYPTTVTLSANYLCLVTNSCLHLGGCNATPRWLHAAFCDRDLLFCIAYFLSNLLHSAHVYVWSLASMMNLAIHDDPNAIQQWIKCKSSQWPCTGCMTSSYMVSSQVMKTLMLMTPDRKEVEPWVRCHCVYLVKVHWLICSVTSALTECHFQVMARNIPCSFISSFA